MRARNMKKAIWKTRLLAPMVATVLLLTASAFAAAPGIKGTSFNLAASASYITQPDGAMVYSWGYGCMDGGATGTFVPATTTTPFCSLMQIPGPTMVVTQGQSITVTLTNSLPAAAGNTSILFPASR